MKVQTVLLRNAFLRPLLTCFGTLLRRRFGEQLENHVANVLLLVIKEAIFTGVLCADHAGTIDKYHLRHVEPRVHHGVFEEWIDRLARYSAHWEVDPEVVDEPGYFRVVVNSS